MNAEEIEKLKNTLNGIGSNLPESLLPYIWDTYNKVRDKQEPRPCGCQSAAGHWINAINYLRNWVSDK